MQSSNPRWLVVAVRNTLVWKGRSRRAEVWWYMLPMIGLISALIIINQLVFGDYEMDDSWYIAELAILAVAATPGVGAAIRRLHDLGRSGWWYLLLAVPVIGFFVVPTDEDAASDAEVIAILLALLGAIILQYWFLQRGTIGDNRFGPDPLMADESRSPSPAIGSAAAHIPIAEGLG